MAEDAVVENTTAAPAKTGDPAAATTAAAATTTTAKTAPALKPAVALTDDSSTTVVGDFPENWRSLMVPEGDKDGKVLKALERYQSPRQIAEALVNAQTKISSGEYRSTAPFPVEGNDTEKALWRKQNGIPESPDKYDLAFGNGISLADEVRPAVDAFLKFAYERHIPNAAAKASLEWFLQEKDNVEQEQSRQYETFANEARDALRKEWGNEYRPNMDRVNALIDTAPEDIRDELSKAVLPSGVPLLSNTKAIMWLEDMARRLNPQAALVPQTITSGASYIDDRLKEIKAWMAAPKNSADWKKYWKDPAVSGPDGEYSKLLKAKEAAKPAR